MIIHVSGSSASGKTYLGNLLGRMYKRDRLLVVDLDLLYHKILTNSKMEQMPEAKDRFEFIRQQIRQTRDRLAKRYKNVLFVGYSDVALDGGEPQYIDLAADHTFFIEIPLDQLIKQFRERAGRQVISTRHDMHVMSDEAIKKMAHVDKKLYRGFTWLKQEDIVKRIVLLIGS